MKRSIPLVWAAATIGVVVGAFLVGRALAPDEGAVSGLDASAPGYEPAMAVAGLSKAGFSGFADVAGLDGRVVISGRITSVTGESVVIETAAGTSTVRLGSDQAIRRLEAANAGTVVTGAIVAVIREPGTENAAAVLVISQP
jgi:hypothetical protein